MISAGSSMRFPDIFAACPTISLEALFRLFGRTFARNSALALEHFVNSPANTALPCPPAQVSWHVRPRREPMSTSPE